MAATALSAVGAEPKSPNITRAANLIREEGFNSSQVMDTLTYLTEVIGPRLTASPNHKRANEWTRDKLASWGLVNAHLEAFGPFGKGWSLERFSAQVVEPQSIPLLAWPKAWSPGLAQPIVAEVVYLNATNMAGLECYKGKLKGAIVLTSPVRDIQPRFEPLAMRMNETNLLRLANAGLEARGTYGGPRRPAGAATPPPARASERSRAPADSTSPNSTNSPSGPRGTSGEAPGMRGLSGPRLLKFLLEEGTAIAVSPSPMGDGGIVFVSSASLPMSTAEGTNIVRSFAGMPRPWATNAPATLPQIALAAEDYNRLVRIAKAGEHLKMAVDLRVRFYEQDLMAYNTVAEIPGADLKDEIVMVGGHLDSWHSGTGATDNAIGVAAAMEAVRIIKALRLEPRRTIRIGLWAGEEQGLLGSKAYVSEHFGYYTNSAAAAPVTRLRAPKEGSTAGVTASNADRGTNRLVRLPEYEKLAAYFNLDNGAGRIRGIHLQGNEAAGPLFRRWLEPFRDLDAATVSLSNTRGTDHTSFDAIGLPGFQFIQDPLDYNTRTHHSNQDLLERIVPEDARQAAVILASFVYNAAMLDERLPRKPHE